MPARRSHRSAGPRDAALFSEEALGPLRQAATDLTFLETRGYATKSAVALVGNRYELTVRQRDALRRGVCSDQQLKRRRQSLLSLSLLGGRELHVDGFNALITVECALGGALLVGARDGCLRDLAGLRGTWRRVAETEPALEALFDIAKAASPASVTWYLDKNVSNSGRLRALMADIAERRGEPLRCEVIHRVDQHLVEQSEVVATADSAILDRCSAWVNLSRAAVEARAPEAWVVDLGGPIHLGG